MNIQEEFHFFVFDDKFFCKYFIYFLFTLFSLIFFVVVVVLIIQYNYDVVVVLFNNKYNKNYKEKKIH